MKTDKLARLQAADWKVGSTEDFLQLSDEEAQLVGLKFSLINTVKMNTNTRKLIEHEIHVHPSKIIFHEKHA